MAKALTWRVLATLITVSVAYLVTGTLKVAAAIGVVDTLIKFFVYYFHERAWTRVHFGRGGPPEYSI